MHIWWIRRDLRLADNAAFCAAASGGAVVIPLYLLPELPEGHPSLKQQFLYAGLHALDSNLQKLGSRLLVRSGDPLDELPRLVHECGAKAVFAQAQVEPGERTLEYELAQRLELKLLPEAGIHPASAVTRTDGAPYTVYTPYSRAWRKLPFDECTLPAPQGLPPSPVLPGVALPHAASPTLLTAGEEPAQRTLYAFISGAIYTYHETRDRMDLEGTSYLAPYLNWGMLSIRSVFKSALEAGHRAPDASAHESCQVFIAELIWREFFRSILWHHPRVLNEAFRPDLRNLPWSDDRANLQAWQDGLTGFPIVDAAMRQLASTGWMHNRARMIAASFLVKDLLINWQAGEEWFMRSLIDGDLAANNGNWQWIAGTGTDAAPYFRIFNPVLQGQKYDPQGSYVRRWLPELTEVPDKYIHQPWVMPWSDQERLGMQVAIHYPAPIIDHTYARQRALDFYRTRRTAG